MKKLYTIICASALTLLSVDANATTIVVGVGLNASGTAANSFTPSTVSAVVGDVIQFTWTYPNPHNVTSTSVPAGAATFASGTLSTSGAMFSYTITVAGTYNYQCTLHSGMTGTINVTGGSGAGITDPTQSLATTAYPTPFSSNITFQYNGVDKISVFNVVGEQIKSVETGGNFGTIEMNFDEMAAGIYFYRTYKDGAIFETRKIVKSKK